MIVLTATYQNGQIILEEPLPPNLEGKRFQIFIPDPTSTARKRRQCGSAKGLVWMSDDFDEPLEEFEEYYQ